MTRMSKFATCWLQQLRPQPIFLTRKSKGRRSQTADSGLRTQACWHMLRRCEFATSAVVATVIRRLHLTKFMSFRSEQEFPSIHLHRQMEMLVSAIGCDTSQM